ncbi:Lar family restriction alleviation protein [Agrobacterium vitis]|uniref:Lar family restriction alleviation protein n=1 Tax=Agrobacterium vitis TaxID=373 RepID=UPI00157474F5|nr:Lar family restriction alleviation protein [Agrobacterium vitis]NSY12426.1 restriction alleviation protein, Lar family [Agrobacterium vitis]NSY22255.1 restriction alleviation protein, Lar family [Agrobacterium vitis]NTA21956.1 restriction alleviation protein, Lar family [Agrobacterium vitis]WEO70254.1 Lar family restriction alleviation protein [Agrobacterium vitis]
MTDTLLPCPFCGSTELTIAANQFSWVACAFCAAEGPQVVSISEATKTWNRRAMIAVECGGEAPPVYVPKVTPVLKLEPGRLYESHNFGLVEYIGLDRFHDETTHEFRISGASGLHSDRRYAKPEKLFEFLKPLDGSAS